MALGSQTIGSTQHRALMATGTGGAQLASCNRKISVVVVRIAPSELTHQANRIARRLFSYINARVVRLDLEIVDEGRARDEEELGVIEVEC